MHSAPRLVWGTPELERRQFAHLDRWLDTPGRKPLILRGARQVGKSTLVRLFAERRGRPLVEVNLERHADLGPAFAKNDPVHLLNVLEALPEAGGLGPDALLFLDEMQAVPASIPALRYLREDVPDLAVLGAGSLLDFALSDHRVPMPVGRIAYLHMGPMTFSEFLNAVGAEGLARAIDTFELGRGLDPAIHRRLAQQLRAYLFTGGMPEAVQTYARTRRFRDISEVHRSIIDTYREDFPKYAGSRSFRASSPCSTPLRATSAARSNTSTSPGRTRPRPSKPTSSSCAWLGCCRK